MRLLLRPISRSRADDGAVELALLDQIAGAVVEIVGAVVGGRRRRAGQGARAASARKRQAPGMAAAPGWPASTACRHRGDAAAGGRADRRHGCAAAGARQRRDDEHEMRNVRVMSMMD